MSVLRFTVGIQPRKRDPIIATNPELEKCLQQGVDDADGLTIGRA